MKAVFLDKKITTKTKNGHKFRIDNDGINPRKI